MSRLGLQGLQRFTRCMPVAFHRTTSVLARGDSEATQDPLVVPVDLIAPHMPLANFLLAHLGMSALYLHAP